MSELRELYQEIVLDHGRRPRNFRKLEDAGHRAEGHNPLCGDQVSVYARVVDGRIEEITFQGSGCLISIASASLMTGALEGKSTEESVEMVRLFNSFITGRYDPGPDSGLPESLRALGGVREFPVRIKCATLPWHALIAALEDRQGTVTTE
jgi:nitrogen fixation NifU-like protein